jgi:hypothetical protein
MISTAGAILQLLLMVSTVVCKKQLREVPYDDEVKALASF